MSARRLDADSLSRFLLDLVGGDEHERSGASFTSPVGCKFGRKSRAGSCVRRPRMLPIGLEDLEARGRLRILLDDSEHRIASASH
jgi:hypothetical protein